jgi:hypothetical protein
VITAPAETAAMNVDDKLRTLTELIGALQAKIETDEAIIAALLATHPDVSAVAAQWRATARIGLTDELLHAAALPPELRNPRKAEALRFQVEFWESVLQGLIQSGPPSLD